MVNCASASRTVAVEGRATFKDGFILRLELLAAMVLSFRSLRRGFAFSDCCPALSSPAIVWFTFVLHFFTTSPCSSLVIEHVLLPVLVRLLLFSLTLLRWSLDRFLYRLCFFICLTFNMRFFSRLTFFLV